MLLSGTVTNDEGIPLEAALAIIDLNEQKKVTTVYSDKINGKYLVPLKSGKEYAIRAVKEGYTFTSEHVYLPEGSGYREKRHDLVLSLNKKSVNVVLKNVFFETGDSKLSDKSKDELLQLVLLLTNNAELNVEILGHTDDVGKEEANIRLSQLRANSVKIFLELKGVDGERIKAKGYGSSPANHKK